MDASEDSVIGVSIDLAHPGGKPSIERPVALKLPLVTASAGHRVEQQAGHTRTHSDLFVTMYGKNSVLS
jgi:hypothetical protein